MTEPTIPDSVAAPAPPGAAPRSRLRTVVGVVLRAGVALVALVVATVALANIFDDLDLAEVRSAVRELSDAEWLSLVFAWIIWIGCQGLQTASLVRGLPARRGVLAYLGPSAVSSVIPGPSDLPVRYAMYQSWGVPRAEAATAVGASGVFSIGSQLALPALAGVAIFFGDLQIEGFLSIIVATTLTLAVLIVVAAFVLGSEGRTRRAGELLQRPWDALRRLLRKPPGDRLLAESLIDGRRETFDYLRDKWRVTTLATFLTLMAKASILVMTLRFVGIPEDTLGWAAIGAVFALVAGITMIPITPGAAGVAEIALVGMLTPIAGSSYVNAVAAGVLLYRLLTWLALIPAGLVALGIWRVGTRVRPRQAAVNTG